MKDKNAILVILSLFLLFGNNITAEAASTKSVNEIKSHPKKYHTRNISVSGYVYDVEYIPHENSGVLNIKLADLRIEEGRKLKRADYLFYQETGSNIDVLTRVYDEARTAKENGDMVIVKGVFDKKTDSLKLNRFTYFVGGKKYSLLTDKGDRGASSGDDEHYYRRKRSSYPYFSFGYYGGYPRHYGHHRYGYGYHSGYYGHHYGNYGYYCR